MYYRKITIGHDSQIGAGAVVVKDVPAYSVVVGNPAHVIKQDTHKDMMVISEIEPKKY